MDESKMKRAITEANYWLFTSPHERTEEGGLIMAEYVLDACEKIERYEQALKTIIKTTSCDDTWDFANRTLENKIDASLSYRFNNK